MNKIAEISSANPSLIGLILDTSHSTSQTFGLNTTKTINDVILNSADKVVCDFLHQSATNDAGVKDYFDVLAVGFGREASSLLPDEEILKPISFFEHNYLREVPVEDPEDAFLAGSTSNVKWFDKKPSGGTNMAAAFEMIEPHIRDWCLNNPYSVPPAMFLLTDGAFTGDDPTDAINRVLSLGTEHGSTRLFVGHVSTLGNEPIVFPSAADALPDDFARWLYNIASPMPLWMQEIAAKEADLVVNEGRKGFCFNANLEALATFMDIGTRPA